MQPSQHPFLPLRLYNVFSLYHVNRKKNIELTGTNYIQLCKIKTNKTATSNKVLHLGKSQYKASTCQPFIRLH